MKIKFVIARRIAGFFGAAVVTACGLLVSAISIPSASAAPCPDIGVVFARGTGEPPGVGGVGQAFVDSLRSQVGLRSVGVYAVDYPATDNFGTSVPAGGQDASAHLQFMAANCPNTRMVLGGYSEGAAVIGVITSSAWGSKVQMPSQVADNVAAVAVFGNPSNNLAGGPLTAISPLFGGKTIDLCVPGDPICGPGSNMLAHEQYVSSGMTNQAATFAAGRL